jgi:capping protein (actin filament) muscle Z-line, beta
MEDAVDDTDDNARQFILSEHNRDGDSYRSPWSNVYYPPLDDGFYPPERLRSLELRANEVFDAYCALYYGNGTSVASVYLWDKAEEGKSSGGGKTGVGFAGAILIRNAIDDDNYWNSVHVVDVTQGKEKARYSLTSTILLSVMPKIDNNDNKEGKKELHVKSQSTNISGSLSRHSTRECKVVDNDDNEHIINIGKFVEDVECTMRSDLDGLYIQKTKTVINMIRKQSEGPTQGKEHTRVLNEAVLAMAMSRKALVTMER